MGEAVSSEWRTTRLPHSLDDRFDVRLRSSLGGASAASQSLDGSDEATDCQEEHPE